MSAGPAARGLGFSSTYGCRRSPLHTCAFVSAARSSAGGSAAASQTRVQCSHRCSGGLISPQCRQRRRRRKPGAGPQPDSCAQRRLCVRQLRLQPTTKNDPHLGMPPPPSDCGNVQLLEAACSGAGSAVCRCAPLQDPPSSAGTRHCKIRTPHPPINALRRNPLPYPSENYLNMKRQLHIGGAADLNLWITDIASGSLIGCAICLARD